MFHHWIVVKSSNQTFIDAKWSHIEKSCSFLTCCKHLALHQNNFKKVFVNDYFKFEFHTYCTNFLNVHKLFFKCLNFSAFESCKSFLLELNQSNFINKRMPMKSSCFWNHWILYKINQKSCLSFSLTFFHFLTYFAFWKCKRHQYYA